MPGRHPLVTSKVDRSSHTTRDLEQAAKVNHPLRASLIQCLPTTGAVVVVAALGLIMYHLVTGFAGSVKVEGASTPVLSLLTPSISKNIGVSPKGDDRKYQHTVLPNGLQVVNVQDKRTVRDAFAVAVEAGSFDDPTNLPGLAHFCEHMLFLGTKKYPDATGFDNFMSANGGFNNAYTADEVTVYFGELSQAASSEGMDRFADFFRAPLFDKQYVSKEVHAIDSEHAKNVQDPQRRILQVAFSLANPKSPVGAFHTGDAETLYNIPKKEGIDPVDELKVYFKNNYCPPKIRLVTYSSQPLHQQLEDAKKKFGSLTSNSKCKAPRHSYAEPEAWGSKRMGQYIRASGTLPQGELWLHFSLPDLTKDYQSQPLQYIDHVLGYSGEGSLVRVLQDHLGLVTQLQTMYDMNSAGTSLFVIATLTKQGQANSELILDVIYAYLAKLRAQGIDQKLYDSLAHIAKLKWDWAEPASPSDTASGLAETMVRLPPKDLLSGDSLIQKPNSTLVSNLLAMLTPDNMNVIFVQGANPKSVNSTSVTEAFEASDKENSSSLMDQGDIKLLPHYGVKYSVQALNAELPGAAQRWTKWISGAQEHDVESGLASRLPSSLVTSGTAVARAPPALEDVPTDISLTYMHATKPKGDADAELFGDRPQKLSNFAAQGQKLLQDSVMPHSPAAQNGEVWYRSGWATTSPKVQVQLILRPLSEPGSAKVEHPEEGLRLTLFGRLFSEALSPKMVDLTATGVGYSVDVSPKGLTFTVSGFTPMMPKLITKVVQEFNEFNGNSSATTTSRFERVTQEAREALKTYSDMPVSYAIQDRNMLLEPDAFSREESLKALEKISKKSASSSVNDILFSQPLRLTSLAMGNMAKQQASETVASFVDGIQIPNEGGKSLNHNGEPERVAPVPKFISPVEIRAKNPRVGDPNDAVVISLVSGVSTVRNRVVLGILGEIIRAVAYNELRTSQQLGYVVNAGTSQVSNVQYVSCIVQGNVMKADDVEAAIEHVYTNLMPKKLAELTETEFQAYKNSFRQELMQPPQKFQDEIMHFWGPVAQGGKCFDLRRSLAQYLDESLHSKDELVKEWKNLATPTEGLRKKIVVKYFAEKIPPRPSEENAAATWAKQGVDDSAVSLLRREYHSTKVFDHMDSKVRDQLVKEGGYYPQELHCELDESTKKPSPHFLKKTTRHSQLSS